MTGCARTGTVYFARVGDFVKIGYASNPYRRVETLLNGTRLILPEGLDQSIAPSLILVVPFCRVRDERNMQLLFANHWVVGEWFRWSPAFEEQMRGMSFVTYAVRRKWLAEVRKEHGGAASHHREERWGMQTQELLAHLAEWRASHLEQRAAA